MLVHYVMCVAHDVCVMLRSSSMFLVSFCYVIMGEKIIIIVLSQHLSQQLQLRHPPNFNSDTLQVVQLLPLSVSARPHQSLHLRIGTPTFLTQCASSCHANLPQWPSTYKVRHNKWPKPMEESHYHDSSNNVEQ